MFLANFIKTARLIGLCCFLFSPFLSLAQSPQVVNGFLLDAETGLPIVNAVVSSSFGDQQDERVSDFLGEFVLEVGDSLTEITITHPNYIAQTMLFERAKGNEIRIELLPMVHLLREATVQSYNVKETEAYSSPSATSIVGRSSIRQDQQASFQNALNLSPGVLMESRGLGGSRRISIRGSGLRSPFAVRNIKMYFDGIPISNPDGSVPFEMIDPFDVASIEVLKGPIGGAYGSANGGAMFFSRRKAAPGIRFNTELTLGDFGFLRSSNALSFREGPWEVRFSGVGQEFEGYREQEFNNKTQANLWVHHQINNKNAVQLWYSHFDGAWGLPGAIQLEQALENPQQAREYSVRENSRVERLRNRITASFEHVERRLNYTASVYAHGTDKFNPYGTSPFFNGIKGEEGNGAGGRAALQFLAKNGEELALRINSSFEYHFDDNTVRENYIAGDLFPRYENSTLSQEAFLTLGAQLEYKKWILELGTSGNYNAYANQGFSQVSNQSLDTTISQWSLLPRLGMSRNTGDFGVYFLNVATGNSLPSIFEYVDTQTGAFSNNLSAEKALNLELGTRNKVGSHLYYEVLLFNNTIRDAILPATVDGDQTLFSNAGNIVQTGAEAQLELQFDFKRAKVLNKITYSSNYAYLDSRFDQLPEGSEKQNGKSVPGVPVHRFNQQLNMNLFRFCTIRWSHQYFDKIALNNENTDFTPSYHLVNLFTEFQILGEKKKLQLSVFGGINNVLDEFYFDFLQINAGFGRYYNPAPPRNEFAGLRLKWIIK